MPQNWVSRAPATYSSERMSDGSVPTTAAPPSDDAVGVPPEVVAPPTVEATVEPPTSEPMMEEEASEEWIPKMGAVVQCRWNGGSQWFPAKIGAFYPRKTSKREPHFDVVFEDGATNEQVPLGDVRPASAELIADACFGRPPTVYFCCVGCHEGGLTAHHDLCPRHPKNAAEALASASSNASNSIS